MTITVGSQLYSLQRPRRRVQRQIKLRASGSPKVQRSNGLIPILRLSGGQATTLAVRPSITAVVRYGTDPKKLNQIGEISNQAEPGPFLYRFPRAHGRPQARTTYYYTVDSMEANGNGDGVKSPVNHFTTR